jgi:hypothetical protein
MTEPKIKAITILELWFDPAVGLVEKKGVPGNKSGTGQLRICQFRGPTPPMSW